MYRCDITGGFVAFENQFRKSDHSHLGKLLTYFANQDVKVGVWICEEASVEHVKAVQWLNEHSSEDESFFLVTVRAIKIGDSDPAVDFNVSVGPEFKKTRRIGVYRYASMLTKIGERLKESHPEARLSKLPPTGSVVQVLTSRGGLHFEWHVKGPRGSKVLDVALHIEGGDEKANERLLNELTPYKEELEDLIGEEVYYGPWGDSERTKKWRKISVARGFRDQMDEELIEWAVQTMVKMYEFLNPKLRGE